MMMDWRGGVDVGYDCSNASTLAKTSATATYLINFIALPSAFGSIG